MVERLHTSKYTAANPPTDHVSATSTTEAAFQINSVKGYIPVITLSINDSITFLEYLKQGFKRAIS